MSLPIIFIGGHNDGSREAFEENPPPAECRRVYDGGHKVETYHLIELRVARRSRLIYVHESLDGRDDYLLHMLDHYGPES